MGGKRLHPDAVPTPGPWLVRGKADADATPTAAMLGIEPAANDQPGGWPYLIRQDRLIEPGACPLHLATGIQRLADAKLMAAAPDLAEILLRLVTAPDLRRADLDPHTQEVRTRAWAVLVRVAPHLEL